jgi:hypothetical protein
MEDRERVRTNASSNLLRNTINSDAHNATEDGTDRLAEIHVAEGGFGVGWAGATLAAEVGLDCVDGSTFD